MSPLAPRRRTRRCLLPALLVSTGFATHSAQAQAPVELPAIDVRGAVDGEYIVRRASSATKSSVPIHETPVAVQVISRELMDDQQVINVKEATKNVSAVLPSTYQFYEGYTIRGFDTGSNVYRNGLRQVSFSDQQTANVEQVEVLKGPAAILYGRIQPGGLVNVVTKRPLAQAYFSIQQQVGSWDLYRTTIDATGPLTEDGTLLYRVNFARQTNDSFVDFVTNENTFLAPVLTWKPSAGFELNVELEHQRRTYVHFGTNGGGVPAVGARPADIPRSRYIGDPSISVNFPNRQDRDYFGFDWTYQLNDHWKLKHRLGYTAVDYYTHYAGARAFNETTGVMTQALQGAFQDRKSYATNLDLVGSFDTGKVHHEVLVGVDYFHLRQNYKGLGLGATVVAMPAINIYNPVYGDNSALVGATPDNSFFVRKEFWTGFYFQDQMKFGDNLHLLFGGRYDDAQHGTGSNSVIGGSLQRAWDLLALRRDRSFSPRAGILYQPMRWLSVYGNYVESFGTNNGLSATGQAFDPEKARQYEAGVKGELLGGRLTTTLAVFDIAKTNILTRDPANPLFSIPIGEARSRGVEFDFSGRLGNNWNIIGNLTYDQAKVTKDNRGFQGRTLPGVPLRSGSIWTRYDVGGESAEGFSIGTGLYLVGPRQGDTANSYELPGYGRVDASLAYRFRAFGAKLATAQLNIQNLFDKVYFDHGSSSNNRLNNYYGEPRMFVLSLRAQY